MVGSEKEPGLGRSQSLAGKARGREAPQKHVYKRVLERIGVRIALRAVKTHGTTIRSCLMPQGIRSAWLERRVDKHELAGERHDGRRLGSFLHSLSMVERNLSHGGGRWDDPGQAGETDSACQRGMRGGS